MTVVAPSGIVNHFRVGAVISQSFAILFRNIVPFGGVAVAALAIWYGLVLAIDSAFGGSFADFMSIDQLSIQDDAAFGATYKLVTVFGFGAAILYLFTLGFVTAAIVFGTVQHLRGMTPGIVACIRAGGAAVLPATGVNILVSLIIVVFMIALFFLAFAVGSLSGAGGWQWILVPLLFVSIVAAIAVILRYWVAVPVVVIERPGIVNSLRRSALLTKGNRWRLFGVLLLLAVMSWALSIVTVLPIILVLSPAVGQVAHLLVNAITMTFASILIAVAYYHLRVAKEGVLIEDIAKVFD